MPIVNLPSRNEVSQLVRLWPPLDQFDAKNAAPASSPRDPRDRRYVTATLSSRRFHPHRPIRRVRRMALTPSDIKMLVRVDHRFLILSVSRRKMLRQIG